LVIIPPVSTKPLLADSAQSWLQRLLGPYTLVFLRRSVVPIIHPHKEDVGAIRLGSIPA
jgi:hypothetical protein